MRFRKVDLLRYGHFTDTTVDFMGGKPDLHLVVGPNEAGKTTLLSAMGDLLYGIAPRTKYGFLHDYNQMRLGAVIENGDQALSYIRKKNKPVLMLEDETPLPDDSLVPFVGNTDRPLFEKLFGLNHVMLRRGGEEILEAKDDVGRMLFEASSGVGNLKEELQNLDAEAERLFKPQGSKPELNQALRKFKEAQAEAKGAVHTIKEWRDLVDKLEEVVRDRNGRTEERDALEKERSKLDRVRRINPHLSHLDTLKEEIESFGELPVLPEGYADQVEDAETVLTEARGEERTVRKLLEDFEHQSGELLVDEDILSFEEEVGSLDEQRVENGKAMKDLPKLKAELAEATGQVRLLMEQIGLEEDPEEVLGKLPPPAVVSKLRKLIGRESTLQALLENGKEACASAEKATERNQRKIDAGEISIDVTQLRSVVESVRKHGDQERELIEKKKLKAQAEERLTRTVSAIGLSEQPVEILPGLPAPSREKVSAMQQAIFEVEARITSTEDRITEFENDMHSAEAELEELKRHVDVPTQVELGRARDERDQSWEKIKGAIDTSEIPSAQDTEGMDDGLRQADDVADSIIREANRVEALTALSKSIAGHKSKKEGQEQQLKTLTTKMSDLKDQWMVLWAECGGAQPDPLEASEWLDSRDKALEFFDAVQDAARDIEAIENLIGENSSLLLETLNTISEKDRSANRLSVLLGEAEEVLEENQVSIAKLRALQERQSELEDDKVDAEKFLKEHEEQLNELLSEWGGAVSELNVLGEVTDIGGASEALEGIEELRAATEKVRGFSHRIKRINEDFSVFENEVKALAGKLSETGESAFELSKLFKQRLDRAKSVLENVERLEEEVRHKKEELLAAESKLKSSQENMDRLCGVAGVEERSELPAVIRACEERLVAKSAYSDVHDLLLSEGDGFNIDHLREQSSSVSADEIQARLDDISDNRSLVDSRMDEIVGRERDLQHDMDEIRNAHGAADAEQEAARLLEDVAGHAEHYLRVKSSARLLRWAIEKHREEKQGPLLERAMETFKNLTLNRYEKLIVNYDDEKAYMTGELSDGKQVSIDDMSDGTRDQLYLALRLSAIRDLGDNSSMSMLPFIADDLLVNFDDERAEAGFKALQELSQSTQVIVFTHHDHLVEVARRALGPDGITLQRVD